MYILSFKFGKRGTEMLNKVTKFTQLESSRAGIQAENSGRRTASTKAGVTSLESQETGGSSLRWEPSAGRQSTRCPDSTRFLKTFTYLHIYSFLLLDPYI